MLAGPSHPLLTLFSPALLQDRHRVIAMLQQQGYVAMLATVLRNVRQFQHLPLEVRMSYEHDQDGQQELVEAIVEWLTDDPEYYLRRLSPEQRLAGLTPDELTAALSPEAQAELLRRLLAKQKPAAEGS